jgi:hypothetical protein
MRPEFDENRCALQNPLAIMWTERFAVTRRSSREMTPGEIFQEWFRLNGEWIAMPAFSFEKISPPARRTPNAPADKKRRSVIGQVLDRISPTRGKRASRDEHDASARRESKA